jgi:hypothetical protein
MARDWLFVTRRHEEGKLKPADMGLIFQMVNIKLLVLLLGLWR